MSNGCIGLKIETPSSLSAFLEFEIYKTDTY
jgi:hypothetical protein